ncbi:phosphate acyltransferase [Oceanicoccus sp. KOV_DT_Chl]|uniref:phosphate acyltransferase n=1 Tax=Oceanicoccus sp. KOV_DT_Chl TaxID=1904639 RepID=UPI000C7BFB82|nr:phosphate acyltransferase [Oceanicoccus sp. KOV_DT_Chl]
MTTTSVLDLLRRKARGQPQRIIFPEQSDPRVIGAIGILVEQGLCKPVLLNTSNPKIPDCEIFWEQTDAPEWFDLATTTFSESRNITLAQAKQDLRDPLLLSALLTRCGYIDAGIAGSIATTANVLRAAIQGIGLIPDSQLLSSAFLMELPNCVLTYGDCAVNPCPTAEQLAQIAIDSAATHFALTGQTPKVALLSFSTTGSAQHKSIDTVRKALSIVKSQKPELCIDGELQFDTAFVANIGAIKATDSPVAGQGNVFIFPDLNSGNIGYKITEHLGGANAIGPVLQGLRKTWVDLSRGCKQNDIVDAAVIASVLSIEQKKKPQPHHQGEICEV